MLFSSLPISDCILIHLLLFFSLFFSQHCLSSSFIPLFACLLFYSSLVSGCFFPRCLSSLTQHISYLLLLSSLFFSILSFYSLLIRLLLNLHLFLLSSALFTPHIPRLNFFPVSQMIRNEALFSLCPLPVLSLWLSQWTLWTDTADYTAVDSHPSSDWSWKCSAVFDFTMSLTLTQSLCLHHNSMFLLTLTYPRAYSAKHKSH